MLAISRQEKEEQCASDSPGSGGAMTAVNSNEQPQPDLQYRLWLICT